MTTTLLRNTICLFMMLPLGIACARSADSNSERNPAGSQPAGSQPAITHKVPESVTLISRYNGGNYHTAVFSFRFMSQNVEETRNNWELLFEAREDFADHFKVNTVTDDISFIYDLGQRRCSEIGPLGPNFDKRDLLRWLHSSSANPSELIPRKSALVEVGHCYLTLNTDRNGRVQALFHVKDRVKSKSVTIDEIELIEDLRAR